MEALRNRSQSRSPAPFSPTPGFWGAAAVISLTITLILFSIQLFFIKPYFLVNDDIFKILMTKGIGSAPSPTPYIGFSNVLLGYGFKDLFQWFPTIPWYGWFLCMAQFSALSLFLWLLLLRTGKRAFGLVSFVGLWFCVYFIFFAFLQFTITAALCAQTGILLFCFAPESSGGRPSGFFPKLSIGLLVLAMLIRQDSLELMTLVSLPLVMLRFQDESFRVYVRKYRAQWMGGMAVLLLLGLFHSFWFQKDPAWREFRDFYRGPEELLDQRSVDPTPQTRSIFDSVGWSANDLWLFKNWYWSDPRKFSTENFKKLNASFPRMGSSGKYGSFRDLRELIRSFWDQRILLFFVCVWALCPGKIRLFLLAQLFWIFLLFLFLIYFFRAPDRVTLPVLVYLLNLAVYFAEYPAKAPTDGSRLFSSFQLLRNAVLPMAFLILLPAFWDYHSQNLERRKVEGQVLADLERLKPREDQLYICWNFPFELIGALNDYEVFRKFHLFELNFSQNCPSSQEQLRHFGVQEPFRDAVDDPHLFLICSSEQGGHYHDYLKENYGLEIAARREFEGETFKVFSIHRVPSR